MGGRAQMLRLIKEDIYSIFDRDPAARNVFETITCYPGLHAVMFHRVSHKLWGLNLKWAARFLAHIARWLTGIEIHPGAEIGRRFFIDHGLGVVIGETAQIGNDVTLYQGVTLGGISTNQGKRHPTLGDGVVVGAGAKILGPFIVGENARVGSNAVVVKAVPANATVIGIPGRVVKKADEKSKQRQAIAEKMGFDAYGLTSDMPDPVSHSINTMLDHIHQLDERIDKLCGSVSAMGRDVEGVTHIEMDFLDQDDEVPEEELVEQKTHTRSI